MPNNRSHFSKSTETLLGMQVSHAWQGHGSTLFIELGSLTPSERGRNPSGEACLQVDWDWRFERKKRIVCGSSSSKPQVRRLLDEVVGSSIERLAISDDIPELTVCFSNGIRLRTMAMVEGDPQWAIKLSDSNWMSVESGAITIGVGGEACSDAERLAFDEAEQSAARWGKPAVEPKHGDCRSCRAFVPLDGCGHFLDYGCCSSPSSSLDGRVVHVLGGCPAFYDEE